MTSWPAGRYAGNVNAPRDAQNSRLLLVVAAPAEVRAVLAGLGESIGNALEPWTLRPCRSGVDVLETGVGKGCASGAVARCFDPARHRAVVNLGVAGALPGSALAIADVVLATQSVYADEGALMPDGFIDVASMGFGPDPRERAIGAEAEPGLFARLQPLTVHSGAIATVSTCSGMDALALEVARRTRAVAEAMEGAAIAFTCLRLAALIRADIPFAEVRVISNTTGDRPRQVWDLSGALRRLSEVAAALPALMNG